MLKIIFGLLFLVSVIPLAFADLEEGEIARYGPAGTSPLQDSHTHPHDRPIWYGNQYHEFYLNSTSNTLTQGASIQ